VTLGPGVYVHIPFCATRCDYCAFATWTDREHLIGAYADACVADVERRIADGELTAAATVYFGGGTPSLLPAALLVRILDAVPRAADAEVTVEANPDSIDAEKLRAYADHGVTRLSLGVQSTQPHVLAALGRTHDRANVARSVDAIRDSGIASFNLDVIAGTAGESDADFEATITDVLALDPPHVSVYGLMVEPGTPLEKRIAAGDCAAPDPDVQADRYLVADDRLRAAGLDWYEVSNWARPGHECRHNLGYWTGQECVAIGAAAHGHTRGVRWWNAPLPERYVERIAAGGSPVAGEERLDDATAASDRFALALRTRGGAPVAGVDPVALAEVGEAGLVTVAPEGPDGDGGRVVLTPAGRLLASEVTLRLGPSPADARRSGVGTRYH
jgi:putative oxygen-independent coproporphyrinogen III oxidase